MFAMRRIGRDFKGRGEKNEDVAGLHGGRRGEKKMFLNQESCTGERGGKALGTRTKKTREKHFSQRHRKKAGQIFFLG